MDCIQLVLLRVSETDEKEQDISTQLPILKKTFSIREDAIILEERGSAWDIDKIKNRTGFLKFLEIAFDAENLTVMDIFLQRYEKKPVELYVWDFARIMRNTDFGMFLCFLYNLFDVKIYSYKHGLIESPLIERPFEKCLRYMKNVMLSWEAEEYSNNISQNVKKGLRKELGITMSNKGNKWGTQFSGTPDNPLNDAKGHIKLTAEEEDRLKSRIISLVNRKISSGEKGFYTEIIEIIARQYKIQISKPYISKVIQHDRRV